MSTSRYLLDVIIRHQVYLEGLKAEVSKEFDPFFREIDEIILSAIAAAGVGSMNELSPGAIEGLIAEITAAEQRIFGTYAQQLTQRLAEVAEFEAEFAEEALRAAIIGGVVNGASAGAAWLLAKTHPLQATGQLLDQFIETWTAREIAAVEAVIRNAHAQGWSMQQTITAIRGTRRTGYTDGLFGRLQRDVDTIVRTSIQHISNTARMAVYEANLDIVIGYRWVSTLDSRTSEICRSLDGQVFEFGKGPIPPVHPNCRSTVIPELKETVNLLGGKTTRASKRGPVPANWTYYEWLKHQPASFQDSVLGSTRGRLLRNGGLSAEEFARLNLGRTFKPRTLEEMRALRPEVFNQAGL